jgi:hypothetical protein
MTIVMQREELIWNVGVLQRVRLSNLIDISDDKFEEVGLQHRATVFSNYISQHPYEGVD